MCFLAIHVSFFSSLFRLEKCLFTFFALFKLSDFLLLSFKNSLCIMNIRLISSVQSFAQLCPTLCDPMSRSTPGLPVHHPLPEFTQTHVHQVSMSSNHLIPCYTLLLLPSTFPSIRVFLNESVLPIRWPKDWRFSFSISPSNEYSGLISFRMYWLYLLAVQGTLESLLQHCSSKASILHCTAFFIVRLSHPYLTTGKTITLTK